MKKVRRRESSERSASCRSLSEAATFDIIPARLMIAAWLILATPAGLEPATCRLEGGCSIQLSYGAGRGLVSESTVPGDQS